MSMRETTADRSGIKLLFFSAEGVRFAVDAGQVAATAAVEGEPGEEHARLFAMLECGERTVDSRGTTVLTIHVNGHAPFHVVVDALDDMAEVPVGDLRSFPPLIEPLALRQGMWGVVERDGRPAFLLDFQLVMKRRIQPEDKMQNGKLRTL